MRIALEMPVLLVMAAMVAFWIGPQLAEGGGARLGFASDPVTLRKWRLRGAFMAVALAIAAAGMIVLACGAAIAGSSSYWLFANAGLLPLGLAGLWRQSRPRNIPAFEMRNPADAQDAHDAESRIEARIRRFVDRPTLPRAAP